MSWNETVGGKKGVPIPCPDGIKSCLVAHYKIVEEPKKTLTDENAPVFGATVANGGAVATPVYSDGTNWKVG